MDLRATEKSSRYFQRANQRGGIISWDVHGGFRLLSRQQRVTTSLIHLEGLLSKSDPYEVPNILDWFARYLSEPVDDAWFASLFTARSSRTYSAEFSNMYAILDLKGWNHIRSIVGSLKVLYTVRSPLERMWSHARFHAQVIGKFDELRSWGQTQYGEFLESSGINVQGRYSAVIQRLKDNFGPEEYLVGIYDLIQTCPLKFLRQVENFLEIPAIEYPESLLNVVHNASWEMEMPKPFLSAARPIIMSELEALNIMNFPVPSKWFDDVLSRTK